MKLGSWVFMILMSFGSTAVFGQSAIPDSVRRKMTQVAPLIDSTSLQKLAQKDTSKIVKFKYPRENFKPKKAMLYGLIPGGGQIYNKQYWKSPFVYIGIAVALYARHWNAIRYKDFVVPYVGSFNDTTGFQTRTKAEVVIRSSNFFSFNNEEIYRTTLTIDQITRGKIFYKRYRDLSWVAVAGIWALSLIEANVSAHLITFDLSEDLSMQVKPDAFMLGGNGVLGAKVVIGFK